MNIDEKKLAAISLEGKVAVVTGAASGIGLAAAKRLAEAQAKVALLDISAEKGKEVAAEIMHNGGEARFFECDVTSKIQCQNAVEEIIGVHGRIDILFNNAGLIIRKNLVDLEEEEWDLVLNVSLKSIYLMSRFIIPNMRNTGGGSIVNSGSGWGLTGGPAAAAY